MSALMGRPVLGMPYINIMNSVLTRYLATPLNIFCVTIQLYIVYGLGSDNGLGLLAMFSVNTVLMISSDLPAWLRRGMHSQDVDAAVLARLRQVGRIQALLCTAALTIAITTTASHFIARETYDGVEWRLVEDFAHGTTCMVALSMVLVTLPTFRALRKLGKLEGVGA